MSGKFEADESYTQAVSYLKKQMKVIIAMFMIMSMGSEYVSELRPPMGICLIPQMIYEAEEPRWNDTDRGKPKNS
jgi:hypothetical protein